MDIGDYQSERSSEINALKARVAQACCVLGGLGLTSSTFGHVSARLPGTERFFVRARGPSETGMRYTTPADIVEVDINGRRQCGSDDGYNPPLEIFIHTEIYRRRGEVNAVVHSHPTAAVLLTISQTPIEPIYGAFDPHSLLLALRGIPVFERSILIHTAELGRELAEFMDDSDVCLMHGHGITTVGNSPEEATLQAIHLDKIATMTQQSNLLGTPKPIPKDEQEFFLELAASGEADYSLPQLGKPTGRAANLWTYYTRLVGKSDS